MSSFAELVMVADTRGLDKGIKSMDRVVTSGGKAEKSVDRVGKEFVQTGVQAQTAGKNIKGAAVAADAMHGAAIRAARGLGMMVAGYASLQFATKAAKSALQFNAAIRETSTLIEGTPEQLAALSSEAKKLSAQFGGSATAQVKAFYQAISAGADGVAGAAIILNQANKLAIGGVTDITTAVDGLTTAVNVYAAEGLTAAQASDALFVAMKAGKTTIGELSSSLGVILPISQAAGVSFDETAAAVAALTKGGLSTSAAVTALKSTLAQIIKPTKEASDAAAALGIDFSATALEAKGLGRFFDELMVATGGSKDELTKLFGSIESLPAVFGFAGAAGKSYAAIMQDMGVKAGETDKAFGKLSEGMDQRLKVVLGKTLNAAISFGNTLLTVAVPAAEALVAAVGAVSGHLDRARSYIAAAVGVLTAYYAPAMVAATLATGRFVAALVLTRAALMRTGIGIVVVGLGELAYRMNLFGDSADDSSQAQDRLNTALASYSGTVGPAARAEVVASARAYIEETRAKLDSAQATLDTERMIQQVLNSGGQGAPKRGSYEAEAAANLEAAQLAVDLLNGKIARTLRELGRLETADPAAPIVAATNAAGGLATNLNVASGEASALSRYLTSLPGALAGAAGEIEVLRAGIRNLASGGTEATASIVQYRKELEIAAGDISAIPPKMQAVVRAGIEQQVQQRIQVQKLNKTYQSQISALNTIKTVGGSAGAAVAGGMDAANKASTKLAESLGGVGDGAVISAIGSVSDAFSDWLVNGLQNFSDFRRTIVNSFKRMLAQMISYAVKNQIVIGLGLTGSVTGGVASAAASAVSGGGGGLGGGFLGSLGAKLLGGSASALLSGIGTGLVNLTGSLATLTGILSGGSLTAGTIGLAIPGLGILIAGIALLVKGFSREYKGSAIRGKLGTDGFEGGEFDFYKGGFLRKNKTVYRAASDQVQTMLDDAMAAVTAGITDMTDVLGLTNDALKGFIGQEFTLWLNGKSSEEIQKSLTLEITKAGDQMAALVLGTEAYTREGESALETLGRLAGSLASVNNAMDLLGMKLREASLDAADAASTLVDAFGGVETMNAAIGAYFDNFYSVSERTETTMRRMTAAFEDLGVAMPQSRDGFRQLVEGIDTTTAAGAELYASLILMSGALSEVLPQVSAFTLDMQGLLSSIGGEIGSLIDTARTSAQDSRSLAQLWYRTATTLRDFITSLLNTNLSAASPAQNRAANRNRFNTAFEMARGGDVEAARDIPGLAKAFLSSELATASTAVEYRNIASQVQGQVNFLAGLSELQGANEDVLVTLYNTQIDVLTNLSGFLQLEGQVIDNLDAGIQEMVENWDGTVDSFEAALALLGVAIADAEAFSYDDLVGRLDVAVALSDNSPRWLRKLVAAADNNIVTTLDLIIRDQDIDPAMRWLAVDSVSEQVKTISFVVGSDIGKRATDLALASSSELRRNIRLIVSQDLPKDVKRIALMGNRELSRAVNVSLDRAGSDQQALRLALSNIGAYAATVTATLDRAGMSDRVKRIVLRQQGSYAAMIEASARLVKSDPVGARILLRQQGGYIANIGATVNSGMAVWKKKLLIGANLNAAKLVTISAAFPTNMTKWQKQFIMEKGGTISRTIRGFVDTGKIGNSGLEFLRSMKGGRVDRTIRALMNTGAIGNRGNRFLTQLGKKSVQERTIKGIVDLSGLNIRQKSLLDAISSARGRLTLGGSFTFSPAEAFNEWFDFSGIKKPLNGLKNPLNRLTTMLDDLAGKVSDDTALRQRQMDLLSVRTKGEVFAEQFKARKAAAVKAVSDLTGARIASGVNNAAGGKDAYIDVEGRLIRPKGGSYEAASDANFTAMTDALVNLGATRGATLSDTVTNFLSDKFPAINAGNARLEKLRDQVRALGGVPTFANGGIHRGGLRIVGERGPELEATGPSRIYSSGQTRKMFDTSALESELRELRKEVAGMRDEAAAADRVKVSRLKNLSDLAEKSDKIGPAPARAEL